MMSQLRMGRFALLFGTVGLAVVAATFYFSAVVVLCGVFALATVLLGVCGIRTRAGRVGLGIALVALPGLTFASYRQNELANANRLRTAPEVYFSPKGGCTDAIVREIRSAKRSVLVQAYYLTNKQIAQSLLESHRRGVDTRIMLDSRADKPKYTEATFFKNAGLEVSIDASHKIAHDKVTIIDDAVVITGSMNFSQPGENSNAENIVILKDAQTAKTYSLNWKHHASHAYIYRQGTKPNGSETALSESDL